VNDPAFWSLGLDLPQLRQIRLLLSMIVGLRDDTDLPVSSQRQYFSWKKYDVIEPAVAAFGLPQLGQKAFI